MLKVCCAAALLWALSIAPLQGQTPTNSTPPLDTLDARLKTLEKGFAVLKNLKVTGYVQAQWQRAEAIGIKSYAGGDFPTGTDNRFTVRRGRIKFIFTDRFFQYVVQPDITERGIVLREIYGVATEPWLKQFSLTAGVFNRPFSYENIYSSGLRETPERARFDQAMLPNERETGAMLSWKWKDLKVDGGLFNGNSIAADNDSRKDFIGRVTYTKTLKTSAFGAGVSVYRGGVRQSTSHVYEYSGRNAEHEAGMFLKDTTSALGAYAPRQYFGADAQYTFTWKAGKTTLRAEMIGGKQPGTASSNESARTKDGLTGDIYIRKANGALFYLVQQIGQSHFHAVLKYDWLDPNTDVSGREIGAPGSNLGAADVRFDTWGTGLNFLWKNLTLMAYYDWVRNESAPALAGFQNDIKDDVLTLRVQVKF